MLVLSRRLNEKIVFPTIETTVQVIDIKSGAVRIGIAAPTSVPVFREEVLYRAGAPPSPKAESTDTLSELQLGATEAPKPLQAVKEHLSQLRRRLVNSVDAGLTAILDAVDKEIATLEKLRSTSAKPATVSSYII
jgi:carbon storage regulator